LQGDRGLLVLSASSACELLHIEVCVGNISLNVRSVGLARGEEREGIMSGGVRFVVLCAECPMGEVHQDRARARRAAQRHHHAGAATIGLFPIPAEGEQPGERNLLGMIFLSVTSLRAVESADGRKGRIGTHRP
jgi:hypothetical protein